MMKEQLHATFYFLPNVVTAKVSLDRLDDFLKNVSDDLNEVFVVDNFTPQSELLDEFKSPSGNIAEEIIGMDERNDEMHIGFSNATFTWHDKMYTRYLTPSRRSFRLRIEGDLFFEKKKINLIVGPTGSGKTSMLHALLGEMHFVPTEPRSYFNLPRQGGVAYAAQESWVQNETIKVSVRS
jgi:ABC-type multidrug transport system fused ATPase/permease subunit